MFWFFRLIVIYKLPMFFSCIGIKLASKNILSRSSEWFSCIMNKETKNNMCGFLTVFPCGSYLHKSKCATSLATRTCGSPANNPRETRRSCTLTHKQYCIQFISEFIWVNLRWNGLTWQAKTIILYFTINSPWDFQRRTLHTACEPISISRVLIRNQQMSKNTDLQPMCKCLEISNLSH